MSPREEWDAEATNVTSFYTVAGRKWVQGDWQNDIVVF